MINIGHDYVSQSYKKISGFEKYIKEEKEGKYVPKFLKLNLSHAEISNNSIGFQFDAEVGTKAFFDINIHLLEECQVQIILNNVPLIKKSIKSDKVSFSAMVDKNNVLVVLLSNANVLGEIDAEIYGKIISQNTLFDMKVIKNSDGFCIVKNSNINKIFTSKNIEDISVCLEKTPDKYYAKNVLLDYCYLKDADGVKSQEYALLAENGICLKNITNGQAVHLTNTADKGAILDVEDGRVVVLVVDQKLHFYKVDSDNTVSQLNYNIEIAGNITNVQAIETNSNDYGFTVSTSKNKGYIIVISNEKLYIWDTFINCQDLYGRIIDDKLYIFIKNSAKKISVNMYQLSDENNAYKNRIYQKNFYNADYIFVSNSVLYFIHNDICSEIGFEPNIH